jgi:hypothetical protein
MSLERREELLQQLQELGFVKNRRPDLFTFHHIEITLLDFAGRMRLIGGEREHIYGSRVKSETILKQVKIYVDEINKELATFSKLCSDVEMRLYELGIHTVQEAPKSRARSRGRPQKKIRVNPWSAMFYLKTNGVQLFSLHAEEEGISIDYLHEWETVKTVDDVMKVLTETWPTTRGIGTVVKKSICTFGTFKSFLPYIFRYGITTVKKVECIVQQTSSDPVARELASLEQLTREYIKINLRRVPTLEDQLAMALVVK